MMVNFKGMWIMNKRKRRRRRRRRMRMSYMERRTVKAMENVQMS